MTHRDYLAANLAHESDCAVHNEPAYPAGPCTCPVADILAAWDARETEWQSADTPPPSPGEYSVALSTGEVTHGWYTPERAHTTESGRVLAGPWTILDGGPDNENPEAFIPADFLNCVVTHWSRLPVHPDTTP